MPAWHLGLPAWHLGLPAWYSRLPTWHPWTVCLTPWTAHLTPRTARTAGRPGPALTLVPPLHAPGTHPRRGPGMSPGTSACIYFPVTWHPDSSGDGPLQTPQTTGARQAGAPMPVLAPQLGPYVLSWAGTGILTNGTVRLSLCGASVGRGVKGLWGPGGAGWWALLGAGQGPLLSRGVGGPMECPPPQCV